VASRALSLDLLTRVRNIHWAGGAVFVIGDEAGRIWYSKVRRNPEKPLEKVGEMRPTDANNFTGTFEASSYALIGEDKKPTFIIGGNTRFIIPPHGSAMQPQGKIFTSQDGRAWREIFSEERRLPREFIWDATEKKFFAWMSYRDADTPDGETGKHYSECWSSINGTAWSLVSSADGDLPNPMFEAHCKYKYTAPGLGGKGFPDGQFGFNPSFTDPKTGKKGLLRTIEDSVPPGYDTAITYAAGVWGRGGYRRSDTTPGWFDVSTDNTKTWKPAGRVEQDPDDDHFINTIAAGPLKDIESWQNAHL
jgi:hypothetical protein